MPLPSRSGGVSLADRYLDRVGTEEPQDVAAERVLHPGPVAELAHADVEGQLEALAAEARDEADRRRRIVQKRVLLRPGPAGGLEHATLHAPEVGSVGNRDPDRNVARRMAGVS